VDHEELREVVSLRLHFCRSRQNCRDDAVKKLVVEGDLALLERLWKGRVIEVRARRVAGFIAREQSDRRLQILVVPQGKERDAKRRIVELYAFDAGGARRRVTWILDVADEDARRDIRRRRAIDDHLRAAEIDVVLRRDDGNLR